MKPTFETIAIVNRGEPAIRLIHAVRELNAERCEQLRTIALFTEPDRQSMFVREADESWCLGPATFIDERDGQRKSKYLDYRALETALRETGAQAAWVGWGFVAEHAEFADLCARLGITFIGPDGDVMRKVGDKIASKRLAEGASVPVSPWSNGPVADLADAKAHADRLGFPLMIKATAGGGGRGVRRVRNHDELRAALPSAQAEALKFFGSAEVFLERAIVGARHVEVQVLADAHDHCWAVGVRDCTIQRRNQKVLEEAPAPTLDAELEREVRAAAVRLSRAARYRNAGTVEFLFEPDKRAFYFMEMNTRLQVEHPVTEATTGIDLVKLQLRVASGLPLEGEPPVTVGHAVEVRLNAEDPDEQFAPAPGHIALFQVPTGPGLRIDTGVAEGDTVAPDFDSMIAKIIAHGRTRDEALGRLRRALLEGSVVIRGGTSNKAFLLELLSHPDVVANRTDIGWLDRTWAPDRHAIRRHADVALIQAALDVYDRELALEQRNFFVAASRGRPNVRSEIGRAVELRYAGQTYKLDTRRVGRNAYRVHVDGQRIEVRVDRRGELERWLTCGSSRHRVLSVIDGVSHLVEVDGIMHRISRDDGGQVRAQAPAVTLAVHVKPGDVVAMGAPLLVLEAMKMEMVVAAPYAGRVRKVMVRPNVQVAAGAPLVLLEPEGTAQETVVSERVAFGRCDCAPEAKAEPRYGEILADMERLMLGYDLDATEAKRLRESWSRAREQLAVDDADAWAGECRLLRVFADSLLVYVDEPAGPFEQRLSAEENLHTYLRSVRLAGKGLPTSFVERLQRALRHYGIDSLEPTDELDEALLFALKAAKRMDECAGHVFTVVDHWLRHIDALLPLATAEVRELLDQVVAATQERYSHVNDLARHARFRFFDRPHFETAQRQAYERLQANLVRLVEPRPGDDREVLMRELVAWPQSLLGLLAKGLGNGNEELRGACLETTVRRFHRQGRLDGVEVRYVDGRATLCGRAVDAEGERVVLASHGKAIDLGPALAALLPLLDAQPRDTRVSLELYAVYESNGIDVAEAHDRIATVLRAGGIRRKLEHICVTMCGLGISKPIRSFTFAADAQGEIRDYELHPGMHPTVAARLEAWRLSNFKTEQLPAPEHIYLFHAVARDNPKDERLFSFVDVSDATPLRDESGKIVAVPLLEHLYLEAVAGIRAQQARRSARDRLQWNRIVLFLGATIDFEPADMLRVAKRLAPAAKNLGLEKTVVRLTMRHEQTGELCERVLHISNRAGTGLRLQSDDISSAAVRPLSPYAQKVVLTRRLQLVYPYEIIQMLTPSAEGEQAEFPPGTFTEYDLDERHELVPVKRAPGGNRANVVVGVIRNITRKHPEGMTRVMILGDGSREMGALAEPECRRIIAAFDLAEQMRVPIDWFPVSSGAKIAMDVGTEGLDWVARVLRRVIEFTHEGGEANVVVTGVNVGGQSYWNAEATMLMHTKGILVMTPTGSMVLTGKRALDYSGGVSADNNQGIGGFERIMGPNGQAQYYAQSVSEACHILLRHYEHAYLVPGERFPRRAPTTNPTDRDIRPEPHPTVNGSGFECVGDVFSLEKNPGRKKPFDIRAVMKAVVDRDHEPFERWLLMRDAETAVTWDAHLGGMPVALIGIESKPLTRFGIVPNDGPDSWTGGTLFPQSSKKVARAINAASGNRPVVIVANLSGFDGSPESLRKLQLENGAEIGRAVVCFDGPMVFCVISRYHGGAYVVFSCTLNSNLEVAALEGSHASVIGGAPAAAVVFPGEVKARTLADERVKALHKELAAAKALDKARLTASYDELYKRVYSEKQGEVAEYFDRIHSVQRAKDVGSLHHIIPAAGLRPYLIGAVERGMARTLADAGKVLRPRLAVHKLGS